MGNFSTKDSHGPTVVHVESFHTPPSSPQSDGDGLMPMVSQLQPSPASSPSPAPTLTIVSSSGKKSQNSTPTSPSTPIPPPDWKPPQPVSPNNPTVGPGVNPVHKNSRSTVTGAGQASLGRNSSSAISTPRTSVSQVKSVAISPIKSPSSVFSTSPPTSSSGKKWKERSSSLSQSSLQDKDTQGKELVELLEESRRTLGITASQDETTSTTEILKHLLTEVKGLKNTLQTERGEWLQFQADLQVAVSVADRLRAEAEEELAALRTAHKDTERELAAAQQRQKEADMQLVTLRGELKESKRRLATLTQAPCQEPGRPSGESHKSESKAGTERVGEGVEIRSIVGEEARIDSKGVTKRYLRNVTSDDKDVADVRPSETRKMETTEGSRSLSRLPSSSSSLTMQNGTSQPNSASTLGPANKNFGELKERRSLDWQDSKSTNGTARREESLNKYNSALTELPPTKSQDGFNLLLRRHGGSKRNSLLRWCQSRTQGYKVMLLLI
ncbi:flocculation protein FLO11 isoform X2 [Melanotaenia boesemani]|uniref:flocculation protein FLO11 isoform X2 n=1 Tax=Melanotaenia boesemani TaxID=1250792 RepID=UPI001C05C090|nr:flocculation protein FLO11 isoform X2 [Melanotaenia boesemani]